MDMASGGMKGGRWRRRIVDAYLALRISTLGFSTMLPLVGAAAVAPGFDAARAAWLLAIALAFHIFAYVLNDVVDLPVDRSEPLRADSPLVRGVITRRQAGTLALLQLPLAFALALAGGLPPAAQAWLGLAFAAMTLYDVYGKRCAWPLLTDAVQSAGWCALMLTGAAGAPPAVDAPMGWLCAYVFLCVMLVNGVHGALRDLANDRRCGARTTAAWFGAQAGEGSAVSVPAPLVRYALALQAGLIVSAIGAWSSLDYVVPFHAMAGAAAASGAMIAATGSLLRALGHARDRRTLVSTGAVNIVATLLVLPALVAPRMGTAGTLVLAAAFALPAWAMWAYNGSGWHIPPAREALR
jgi:4-hydroxybenzoate polyprenyltransferase